MPQRPWPIRSCTPLALLALLAPSLAFSADDPRMREPKSWDVQLSPHGEPGEPFEMEGTVRSRGGDALPKTKVFVYHADAKGNYALTKDSPMRLAGVLRTDEHGRYRIRSIFPGTYGYPAHVHFEVLEEPFGMGFVNVRPEGRQAPNPEQSVVVKRAKDGVWRLAWDLRPSRSGPDTTTPTLRYPSRAPGDSAR